MRRVIIFGGIPETDEDTRTLWRLPKLPGDLKRLDRDLKEKVESEYKKLMGKGNWIILEKNLGQEEIYWAPNILYIDWSRKSVKWLFENSGKKGIAKPVIRNLEYYFRGGVTFTRVGYLRVRVAFPTVFDDKTPLLTSSILSEKFLSGFLNSNFGTHIMNNFLSHTIDFELNALRLLPIVIPTPSQQKEIESLVDSAIETQKRRYATDNEEEKSMLWERLQEIQKQIDRKVEEIYG